MRQVKRNPGFSDLIMRYIQNTETLGFGHISTIEQLAQMVSGFPQSTPNLRSLSLSGRTDSVQTAVPFGSFIPFLLR